jgi:CheY-like chemotaxis protein
VEDNADTLHVMARLLRVCGHEVHTAAGVRSALDVAEHEDFDLLISDIGLPDGSGWELMSELRTRRPVRGIALSGFSMDEDIQKSQRVGFMAHLSKPVNPQELEDTIQRVAS